MWAAPLELRADDAGAMDVDDGAAALCAPHARRVTLSGAGRGARTLTFSYFSRLNLIGVTASPPAAAASLRSLLPDDDGSAFPDERALLRALGEKAEKSAPADRADAALHSLLPAVPYRWAQWLGGIGPSLAHAERVRPFQLTMEALQQWLHAG